MQSIEKQILHLIDVGEEVEAKTLVDIYTQRDYNEMTIRNNLSKLKQAKQITSTKRGWYRLAPAGKRWLSDINHKYANYNQVFTDEWTIVLLRIPETMRRSKQMFKNSLLDYGFGAYTPSVLISPWPYQEVVQQLAIENQVQDRVKIIRTALLNATLSKSEAYDVWRLKDIVAFYETELDWIRHQRQNLPQQELALLNVYLDIGMHINDTFLRDPMLPISLLPDHWIGRQTMDLLIQTYNEIAELFPKQSEYARLVVPMFS